MTDPYAFIVAATVYIEASPGDVYDAVSDVTRFGSWSPECTGGEWLSAVRGVGARFVGHNQAGDRTWSTECEVLVADRPAQFAWHVVTNTTPRTSLWTFRIEPHGAGAEVSESFELLATPGPFRGVLDSLPAEQRATVLEARKRQVERGIRDTLNALKGELEAGR